MNFFDVTIFGMVASVIAFFGAAAVAQWWDNPKTEAGWIRNKLARPLAWLRRRRENHETDWASRAEKRAFEPSDLDNFYSSDARSRRT